MTLPSSREAAVRANKILVVNSLRRSGPTFTEHSSPKWWT